MDVFFIGHLILKPNEDSDKVKEGSEGWDFSLISDVDSEISAKWSHLVVSRGNIWSQQNKLVTPLLNPPPLGHDLVPALRRQ